MMFENFAKRVQLLVGRAILKAITADDEIQLVKLTGLEGEIQDGVERPQPYGLSSRVPEGAELLVLYMQGNRDDGVVVLADHSASRKRDINDGEVALYSTFDGFVHLKDNGKVAISTSGPTSDNAVRYSKLEDVIVELQTAWNFFANSYVPGSGGAGTANPVTESIEDARVDEIEVPGAVE